MTEPDLVALFRAGLIPPSTPVWSEGMALFVSLFDFVVTAGLLLALWALLIILIPAA